MLAERFGGPLNARRSEGGSPVGRTVGHGYPVVVSDLLADPSCAPFSGDAYFGKALPEVPKTLRDAMASLDKSKMLRKTLGDAVVDHYVHTAKWEQFEYDRRITDWELMRGFERY